MTGKIKSIDDAGNVIIQFKLNEKESEIKASISLMGNKLVLKGTVDLEAHHAQAAIKQLNLVCGANHIGKDGKQIMWPDVDFEIHSTLSE